MRQTPLNAEHRAAGARLIEFAGWEMPLHYGSQIEEHHAVRRDAGVFDTSAKHHHADEEEDLFPVLLQAAPESGMASLRELIDALCAQHRELEQVWGQIRWKLEGIWLGIEPELGAEEVAHMADLYQRHIAREEEEMLPLAARLLGDAQLDIVGRAMRLRRGIKEV